MSNIELRFHLTFPHERVTEPVLCRIVREYPVEFNIRRADIRDGVGTMDLALVGISSAVEEAVAQMVELGVDVDPIERTVIE